LKRIFAGFAAFAFQEKVAVQTCSVTSY